MDPDCSQIPSFEPENGHRARLLVLLILVFTLVALWTVSPDAVRAAINRMELLLGRTAHAAAAPPSASTEELEAKLMTMTAQGQAELLISEAVDRHPGALELLNARTDLWRGNLQKTPRLENLLQSAWNSDDLEVRRASLEIYLDIYDIEKNPESVSTLERRIADEPGARPWALWMLGALGNRGIERIGVLREELDYLHDPNTETRMWAVEALATLGTDDAIDPLLDALRNDPALPVRERAACGLAQAGLFTSEQRRTAVPRLLDLAEDPALDTTTRNWVFHALQDITGGNRGTDAHAWRQWWQQHGQ